jgi:dTDP-4-amino-4,6-dideoxygalactose transaminase
MQEIRKIPISVPSMGKEEWLSLEAPLLSGWLTQGPQVAKFEKTFGERHQVKYAIATTSCTTALHVALAALDIGPGDEVIVPAFTWVATANCALYCGAKPVLVDIDLKTFNMDPAMLKAAITPKTKAIIAVHLFGLCADMNPILDIAKNIPVLEDAACAAGSWYHGKSAGALGRVAAFSFHPRKSITTGEGGMVTTNDQALAEKMISLRNHGASISEEERHHGPRPYLLPEFNLLGFNYRMTDLQGAVGNVQLSKLDAFIAEREKWAGYYSSELSEVRWLRTPQIPSGLKSGWQSYVCLVDESKSPKSRNELMQLLNDRGISTRPGTHTIHELQYYAKRFGYKPEDFPNAHIAAHQSIAIPLHNKMTEQDYHYVVQTLKQLS